MRPQVTDIKQPETAPVYRKTAGVTGEIDGFGYRRPEVRILSPRPAIAVNSANGKSRGLQRGLQSAAVAAALALSAPAHAGDAIVAATIPADIPAEIVQEAAFICAEQPAICGLALLGLIFLVASSSDSDKPSPISPVDPVDPPVIPEPEPPICITDCDPVTPLPVDPPAPVPLGDAGSMLALALAAFVLWRGRRQIADLVNDLIDQPGCKAPSPDEARRLLAAPDTRPELRQMAQAVLA